MKRRTTALFLAVAFLISCISFTGFAEEADNMVYLQDYSQEQLEQGQSYREYFYSNTGSSWNLNAAGSWAVEWLVNDSHSKDGNYFVIAPASQNIYLLTIAPTQGGNGRLSMKKSFLFEFSFNSLKSSPNNPEENNRVPGTMEVRIFPEKSTTSNGRSGEGLILTIPVGGDITFVDDTAEKTAEKFATEQNTWYDVKIAADLSTAVPTYSAWIKKSADSDYTLLTEGASFPRSGDYSEGLGVFGFLNVKAVSGSAMAVDDMKITYDVKKVPPSAKAVFASGSGSVGKTLYGMYEFNGSPGEGDSRYEWLVCDSEEGDYQPLSGQNSRTLSLDQSLNNRYVKFQVTPVNQDGEQGEAVQSPTVRIRESDREYGLDQLNNDPGELKIAFLGGSITYGTGASKMENRYSTQLVYNYFKTNFFNKTVTEINSGIGGTPSDLGLMRLNREISSLAPDVVFVEYAVNDGHFDKATTQRQNEGIIRQLLELPKQPVVIPLYTCRDGLDETTADYQKEVAQYYGLGSVSFLDYLKENGGNEAWSKLTTDGVHPNDAGHAKYSEIAIEAFQNDFPRYFKTCSVPEEVMSDHEFRNTTLVPYNEKDRVAYTGNFEINPSDTQKDSFSGFTHWPNGSITSRTIGDQVTFTFRGSTIGLWAMRGTKYGKVSYDIDNGAYTGVIDTNSSYTMAYPVFFRCDLEGGEHTLVLENAGGGTDNLFTYAYFVTDDDFAPKPHCENVRIVGPMRLGGTVQAEFDYDGSQEECSYRWLYYDEEKGSYQPIPGATEQSWKITSAYGDRLVRVEVTAKDGNTSQSPEVRIPGTTETVLYSQTYEQRPLGVTAPTATWSSWCHNMAGSYAYVYLLNDDYSVSGNYLAVRSLNSSDMKVLTIVPTEGTEGTITFQRDFVAEFSFQNFTSREDLDGGAGQGDITVCMWPAVLGTNGRDDAALNVGKLLHIVPGVSISCYDDGKEVALEDQHVPARGEWYDVKIETALDISGTDTPTYSVFLKRSRDTEYTLIAEQMSYPKAYSYGGGISTFAFLNSTQNAGYIGYDNIKLYYPSLSPQPPRAENLSVVYDKAATGEQVTAHYDFIDDNCDEEAKSKFVWYRGDTPEGPFTVIEGATEKSYTLTQADENKYLKYTLTPVAAVAPYEGEPVTSDSFEGAFEPQGSHVRLQEGAVVGRTVHGEFDYFDLNGDAPGSHKYQWYAADSAEGTPEKLEGETQSSIEITEELAGKYLFLEVTPVSTEKPYEGEKVMSQGFEVSSDNSAPAASEVAIDGNAVVGVFVTGTFRFTDPDGDAKGDCLYRWYLSDEKEGDFTPIENQESDTLYLNETYQGKYIKFGVIPVDYAGMKGEEAFSEAVLIEGKLPNQLYVSLEGSDQNDGTLEHPLRTLEAARDAIRQMKAEGSLPAGGLTVYIRGGEYQLEQGFALTREDSGTDDCPVTYRNYRDEKVVLSGKRDIDFSKFGTITDETMKNKLRSEEARSKVLVADLEEIGLEDFEPIKKKAGQSGTNAPMIFFDNQVCNLTRYPNTDTTGDWPLCWFSTTDSRYLGTQQGYWSRENSGVPGTFFIVKYEDEVLDSWTHNTDQYLINGYLKYFWAPETVPVSIDKENHFLRAKDITVYGVEDGTRGRPFQVINVYEEIDEPGEWYVDTVNKKMYIYPTTDTPENFYVTTLAEPMIGISNAKNITVRGLSLSGGRSAGALITNCDHVVLDSCEITGMEFKGVRIDGSTDCGIKNSHIHHIGAGGVDLRENGDIVSMTKSNNFVTNCEINDFQLIDVSYTPAVSISNGVGNLISHNQIYNSEHCAIRFEGPLNVIEYNEFYDVVKTATDMSAIYTGRNLRSVGNEIRYNYFHHVGGNEGDHGSQAVFFDDGTSGNQVYCNVFGEHSGTVAVIKNYGGFDGHYYNNLFLNNPVIGYEGSWKWDYWRDNAIGNIMQGDIMLGASLYYEGWPWLKKLNDNTFSEEDYTGNLFENNLFFGIDVPLAQIHMAKRPGSEYREYNQKNNQVFRGNTEENKAYFEDYAAGNYNLTEQAYTKIRTKIPEFLEIPFLQMGRQTVANNPPQAKNVTLNGMQTLSVTYDYQDAERDLEGNSKFAWYWSDSKDGAYSQIPGADSSLYQVEEQYFGKYIKAEVTPVDEYGTAGEAVCADPVFVVAGVDSLQALVDSIQEVLKNAEAGSDLGQYPADAIKDMEDALKAAKAVLDGTDTETSLVSAAKALDEAYETFKNQQVTTLKSKMKEGTVAIPGDLRRLSLELGEITGTIRIEGVDTLPDTIVNALINGVRVTVQFPAGSKAGDVITPLETPSVEIVGDHYLSAKFGIEGDEYQPAIRITAEGGAGFTLYAVKEGSAIALEGKNAEEDKVFFLSQGGEILLTRLKEADQDASLKALRVNGKNVGAFKPDKYTYIIKLDQGTEKPVVEAEATSPAAKVEIVQAESIPGKAIITVTAQDQSVEPKVYTLAFQYQDDPDPDPEPTVPVVTPAPSGGGGGGGSISIGGSGKPAVSEDTVRFTDIAGHWAEKDITEMAQRGIVSGVTETTFEPDRSVTRAEFAALIVRALKLSAEHKPPVFTDVAEDQWYADEVAAAAAAGLVAGYEGKFRPEDTITREEMAVIIMKAYTFAGKEAVSGGIDRFADRGDISDWAADYVDQAAGTGMITGMTSDTFAPKENASRAQTVSVIKRLLDQ